MGNYGFLSCIVIEVIVVFFKEQKLARQRNKYTSFSKNTTFAPTKKGKKKIVVSRLLNYLNVPL